MHRREEGLLNNLVLVPILDTLANSVLRALKQLISFNFQWFYILHIYNKQIMTPWQKWFLQIWLTWHSFPHQHWMDLWIHAGVELFTSPPSLAHTFTPPFLLHDRAASKQIFRGSGRFSTKWPTFAAREPLERKWRGSCFWIVWRSQTRAQRARVWSQAYKAVCTVGM